MILQPEESFEELVRRFGIGTEGRGATLEVVDSYPVEVVARGGAGGGGSGGDGGGRPSDGGDGDAAVEEEEPEFGTCGIEYASRTTSLIPIVSRPPFLTPPPPNVTPSSE